MRPLRAQFFVTITLAFGALHCSNAGDTVPGGTGGGSNAEAGRAGMPSPAAGAAGTMSSHAGAGGTNAAGNGGAGGSAAGAGGTLGGAAGSAGSSGTASGMGGGGAAGAGGGNAGAAGRGFGGMGAGMGGMNGGAGAATGGGGATGGSGGSASGLYQQVLDIISKNCATNECHQNMKGQHANFHNTDGMLYQRLVSTTTTIPGAAGACAKDPLVVPGDPDKSLIIKMIIEDDAGRMSCGKRMPDDCPSQMPMRPCLTDAQIETIRSWIAAGAPQN